MSKDIEFTRPPPDNAAYRAFNCPDTLLAATLDIVFGRFIVPAGIVLSVDKMGVHISDAVGAADPDNLVEVFDVTGAAVLASETGSLVDHSEVLTPGSEYLFRLRNADVALPARLTGFVTLREAL